MRLRELFTKTFFRFTIGFVAILFCSFAVLAVAGSMKTTPVSEQATSVGDAQD